MTYIENVFVCIGSPLLIAAFAMGKRYRRFFLFCFAGMGACLLSAYISSFFVQLCNADMFIATTQIAPVVEEIMKLLPLLFYLLVFEPESENIRTSVLIVAASFASFENIVYLTQNGAAHLSFLIVRGFGAGAMHIVCGVMVSYGLVYVWQNPLLKIAGTTGLLGVAITFHAIYNLLIAHGSITLMIAYGLPLVTLVVATLVGKLLKRYGGSVEQEDKSQ